MHLKRESKDSGFPPQGAFRVDFNGLSAILNKLKKKGKTMKALRVGLLKRKEPGTSVCISGCGWRNLVGEAYPWTGLLPFSVTVTTFLRPLTVSVRYPLYIRSLTLFRTVGLLRPISAPMAEYVGSTPVRFCLWT